MEEILKEISSKIETAKKIAICSANIDTSDKAYAILALAKHLEEKGKELTILCPEPFSPEIKKLYDSYKTPYSHEAKPLVYVISIDYGSTGIEKVTWNPDEKTGKLNFYIVPTSGTFDFNNVEYSSEGNNFDLTITVDITSFKEMKMIYEKSDYLFKQNTTVSLAREIDSLGDIFYKVENESSYIEAIYDIIKESTSNTVRDIVLAGLITDSGILEGAASRKIWSMIGSIVDQGGNVNQVIKKIYFSKSYPNLDLQIKMVQNIKVDRHARVIWSAVSEEEMRFCGVNEDNLDIKGRVIFNISSDFDLALEVYEIRKDVLKVVVESNSKKYDASRLAAIFDGVGSKSHAECTIKDMPLKDFEKRIFTVITDVYGLTIKGHGVSFKVATPVDESQVNKTDTQPRELTETDKNDKNVTQKTDSVKPVVEQSEDSQS